MQSYKKMEEAQPEDEEAGLMMDNGTQPVGANGTHPRPPHMEMDRAPLFGPFVVAGEVRSQRRRRGAMQG